MTDQMTDEISAVEPPTAMAAAHPREQTAEQKRVSMDTESPSNDNPNVIESLDVSEDSNSPPKVRSKLRTLSIILMLCVRVSLSRLQRAPAD